MSSNIIDLASPQSRRETLEWVRAFTEISDPAVRKRLLEVAKAISKLYPTSLQGGTS